MAKKLVVTIDRTSCMTRTILIDTIASYIASGAVVQVKDKHRRRGLSYELSRNDTAVRLRDSNGRQIGVFADVAALVDHAEAVTST